MTEKTQVPTPEQIADAIIADWLYSPYLGRNTKQPELRKAIATAITQAEERGRQEAMQAVEKVHQYFSDLEAHATGKNPALADMYRMAGTGTRMIREHLRQTIARASMEAEARHDQ